MTSPLLLALEKHQARPLPATIRELDFARYVRYQERYPRVKEFTPTAVLPIPGQMMTPDKENLSRGHVSSGEFPENSPLSGFKMK
jgi:hypothetical protein